MARHAGFRRSGAVLRTTIAMLAFAAGAGAEVSPLQERADRFLALVNSTYQAVSTVESRAQWDASTDVSPEHDAAAAAAGKARAAFVGNPAIIRESRELLARETELTDLTVRQLRRLLQLAAEGPMTNPELVSARIDAETRQASLMNSFAFELEGRPVTVNEIDELLVTETSLDRRREVWEASKRIGPVLRPGLAELQGLRNGVARELGYPDFFALQADAHGMTTAEMLALQESFLRDLEPLYRELHAWARHELATRYGQPVPDRIPAHWLPNRWAQDWQPMVEVEGLGAAIAARSPEWIVRTAEKFYTDLGRPPLPESFWKASDLYPVSASDTRRKNTHASCWHVDLENDIRSLMSVESDPAWFATAHHELGHAYYDIAYTRPEVPYLLREGASPAFHEGFAMVAEVGSRQIPYLQSLGLVPADRRGDEMPVLLHEALAEVPFLFFASGTMTHWEADLYAHAMPPGEWNARWWRYVREYQGVDPPSPRGEGYCDPATKTHINDTPAYYPSYAIATVFQYQVHDHIARRILHEDPRNCSYVGHPEVGAFLEEMQRPGATEDWRAILREATGEDLSTRAMMEYFRPLMAWLEEQNAGRRVGWK